MPWRLDTVLQVDFTFDCSPIVDLFPIENISFIAWQAEFSRRFVDGTSFVFPFDEEYPSGRRVRVEGERLIINTTQLRSFQVEPDDDSDDGLYRCIVCGDPIGCLTAEVNLFIVGAPPRLFIDSEQPKCELLYNYIIYSTKILCLKGVL